MKLITCFGPFTRIKDNPSIPCIKQYLKDKNKILLPKESVLEWIDCEKSVRLYNNGLVYLHTNDAHIIKSFESFKTTNLIEEAQLEIYFDPIHFKSTCTNDYSLLCMPVSYIFVNNLLKLYKDLELTYSIHIGVGLAGPFVIELLGNIQYITPDIYGHLPDFIPKKPIHTKLPIPQIFESLKSIYFTNLKLSTNPGSFVCDYTMLMSNYYTSNSSVFLHIPSNGIQNENTEFVKRVEQQLSRLMNKST